MKQLKFNPDKDMKELEKYGFTYTEFEDWHYSFNTIEVSRGNNNEFVIDSDNEVFNQDIEELIILSNDLIKANLLIVESDEDEC